MKTTPEKQTHTSKLSCKSCRTRKVKCDLKVPCGNCIKNDKVCEPTTSDMRRKNYSSTYVKSLEYRVSNLEKRLRKLKNFSSNEHQSILHSPTLKGLVNVDEERHKEDENNDFPVSFDESNLSVYGALSVYYDKPNHTSSPPCSTISNELNEIYILRRDADICERVSNFFKWQYTDHFTFIHRDSFLTEFFDIKNDDSTCIQSCIYCSKGLVYSLVALSSKISDVPRTVSESSEFYNKAKAIVFNNLNIPKITTIQTLLCLAFYDLGEGDNSSAWLLSGIAFRMGIGIGFQLNPQNWHINNKKILSDQDIEIRKRIYWGCYTADHFISLMLGRPCQLRLSISTIPHSDNLPLPKDIENFEFYDPSFRYKVALPLKKNVNLLALSEYYFYRIFVNKKSDKFCELHEYNHEAMKWRRELPDTLSWNQNNLKSENYNPCVMGLRYIYYIMLLCFNRPFMTVSANEFDNSPRSICYEVINDLYIVISKFLKELDGKEKISLLITYASIMSISVILTSLRDVSPNEELKIKLKLFLNVLKSGNWKLSRKSYEIIRHDMTEIYADNGNKQFSPPETDEFSIPSSMKTNTHEDFFGDFTIPSLESFVNFNEDLFNVNERSDFIDLFG